MNFSRFLTISEKISRVTRVVIFCTTARTRGKSRRSVGTDLLPGLLNGQDGLAKLVEAVLNQVLEAQVTEPAATHTVSLLLR